MSTGHFYGLGYHRRMLTDRLRTESFRDALEELITPDDVVVDIGAGTGILSLFAARAGARRVFAVESTPIAGLARQIIADNDFADVIEVFEADARTVELPEPATILVSECLGNFVLSDGMLNVLRDSKRLLTPNARIIPSVIDLELAPSRVSALLGGIDYWRDPLYGFDYSSALAAAFNEIYQTQAPSALLVAPPQNYTSVVLTETSPGGSNTLLWTFEERSLVDSVLAYFSAQLSESVHLHTGPDYDTHWGQMVFPLPSTEVDPGDQLRFTLDVEIAGEQDLPRYIWSGAFCDPKGNDIIPFKRGLSMRW